MLYASAHSVREPEGNIFDIAIISVGIIIIKIVSLDMAKAALRSGSIAEISFHNKPD